MDTKAPLRTVGNGDLEGLRQMIKANPSLKEAEFGNWTLLRGAAHKGHSRIVEYLVGAGADKDSVDKAGRTALYWAARSGRLEVVRLLLEAGAEKDKATDDGKTPLMGAAEYGNLDVVRYLLEEGADAAWKSNGGKTALMIAEGVGHAEVSALLREYLPGGLMYQRRDAVEAMALNAGLGPNVAKFCGDFVMNRKDRKCRKDRKSRKRLCQDEEGRAYKRKR